MRQKLEPGLYQRRDGTVVKLREDGSWQYLSPLFGEWLDIFDQSASGIEKYPRNLEIPQDALDYAAMIGPVLNFKN